MESLDCRFAVGDRIEVKQDEPHGNPRTPKYVRGKSGVIAAVHGVIKNPKDHRDIYPPLYTVRFDLMELFQQPDHDSIWVDIHEEWLQPA